MLSQKYSKQFLNLKENKILNSTINKLIIIEKEFNKSFLEWNIEQLEEFLVSFHSESATSITRNLQGLRKFAKYICGKESIICPEYKLKFGRIYELVDYDKILKSVINEEEYKSIVEQLSLNIRDKLIVVFVWEFLLSNEEIRNIKVEDISFEDNKVKMKISDSNNIIINDFNLIEDIKKCIEEKYYYVNTKDNKSKKSMFRESKFLFKPVLVGRAVNTKEESLSNPSITLKNVFKVQKIKCLGIDLSKLVIEDIRRSRVIYMLQTKSIDDIKVILNSGNIDSQLYWYKKLSDMKYKLESIKEVNIEQDTSKN